VQRLRSDLTLYYGARFSGQVGHNLFMAALLVIAGTGGHAAAGLSSLVIAGSIASIIFGVPGGALSDKLGPARGYALGSALRAAIIALAVVFNGSTVTAVGAAFLYTSVSQLHNSSEMALVKILFDRSAGRVHSVIVAFQYAAQAIGYLVLAPILYFLGGVEAALIGALIILCVHTAATAFLGWRVLRRGYTPLPERARPFAGLRATLNLFGRSEAARDALAVISMKALVSQVILVAFPLYVRHDLALGNEGAVWLMVPGAAGIAAGLAWSAWGLKQQDVLRTMRLSIAGMAVAVFALAALDYGVSWVFLYSQVPTLVRVESALNLTAIVAMPVAFLMGATMSVSLVSSRLALTAAAPLNIQSRVFAVQGTVTDALVILPLLFAGIAAETLGVRMTLASLGGLCAATSLLMWHPWFQLPVFQRRAVQQNA
jgi:hypothetical protein